MSGTRLRIARVSKKTRPRRRAASGGATSTSSAGSDTFVDRMLSSLWKATAAGDPLQAELEAATCLILPRVGQLDPETAEAFISRVLVDQAIRRPSPEGAATLRLMMTLGSPATKRAASRALGQLIEADIYPPEWVTEVGRPVPGQAWRRYDVFGDDEAVAVTFSYGEAEHGILVQIDRTGIPVATAVGVASDAAQLIEAIGRDDDPFDRVQRIGQAEARRRMEAPLARCDEDPDPGLSLDTIASLPIARSRVRRLPTEGAEQPAAFNSADRAAAVDDFLKSPLAAEAVAADEDATRFWAEVLTGYSSRIPGEPPAQVGPRKLAHILLGHVPNTFTLSPAQRRHLEPAVTAWIDWSAACRDLDEAATARLAQGLPGLWDRFDEAYNDPDAVATRGYLADLAASDADVSWLAGQAARRMFAVPMPKADVDGRRTDVGDPAARRALAEAEFARCTPPDGTTSEQFVTSAHGVIEEIWRDDPAATFQAAGRMSADGAARHDIIHALAEAKDSSAGR
jgi:hypothetical protein